MHHLLCLHYMQKAQQERFCEGKCHSWRSRKDLQIVWRLQGGQLKTALVEKGQTVSFCTGMVV